MARNLLFARAKQEVSCSMQPPCLRAPCFRLLCPRLPCLSLLFLSSGLLPIFNLVLAACPSLHRGPALQLFCRNMFICTEAAAQVPETMKGNKSVMIRTRQLPFEAAAGSGLVLPRFCCFDPLGEVKKNRVY